MSLPTRNLDDRTFQQIVDEAKRSIARLCPGWTDHNVSDPGVTLVELFAWMTEMIIYRLNQVPEKHYIKLLELLGLKRAEPRPARVELTFSLSAPQPEEVVLPQGTEVATPRTHEGQPIIFSTDETLIIRPATLVALTTEQARPAEGESLYKNYYFKEGKLLEGFLQPFSDRPQRNDALYFGFAQDLSQHLLELYLTCDPNFGVGIVPTEPPWKWEIWSKTGTDGGSWREVEVELDDTMGMERPGKIRLRLPGMTATSVNQQSAFWLRCRIEPSAGPQQYLKSPRISQFVAESWGGFVQATHTATAYQELLGRSDGTPGQIFYLEYGPVLKRTPGETIEIREPGKGWESWQEVPDFAASGPQSKHFTCDSVSREIRFGPALRQQDGSTRSYGAVPPRGSEIRFSRYRYGGGAAGNVQARTLTVIKTTLPYVDGVTNRHKAEGGLDAEDLEHVKLRALKLLHTRHRAVTGADYEFLTWQADQELLAEQLNSQRLERVYCLEIKPDSSLGQPAGQIDLLIVPKTNQPGLQIDPKELELKPDLCQTLQAYLADYRLLTVRLHIRKPAYIQVAVELSVVSTGNPEQVEQTILAKLYQFLNPINGGPSGEGWPWGRPLYLADIYTCLGQIPEGFVEAVHLYQVQSGERREITSGSLVIPADGLIISDKHKVTINGSKPA